MKIADALRAGANDAGSPVEAAYIKLCKECAHLQRAAKDAAFPDLEWPEETPGYLASRVNDGAHAILDTAHELLYALKAQKTVDNHG